jgi:hypothetical protein
MRLALTPTVKIRNIHTLRRCEERTLGGTPMLDVRPKAGLKVARSPSMYMAALISAFNGTLRLPSLTK